MLDSELRALLQRQPNPIENIEGPDSARGRLVYGGWMVPTTAQAAAFFKTGKRIVPLACGHYVLTRAVERCGCPRCGAMIRAGYDYDGFRRLQCPDTFAWADDPLRELNEPDGIDVVAKTTSDAGARHDV